MYHSFFQLTESPFNVNPDPRYLYLTKEIEEATAGLVYGIQSRKGFVTLIGEVGTGKTTLVNRLLEWMRDQQIRAAFLFNSRVNSSQLLEFILADFGIPCESRSKTQQLMKLKTSHIQFWRKFASSQIWRRPPKNCCRSCLLASQSSRKS